MTDLVIQKGETFSRVIRWSSSPFIYKAISAITKAGPAVITASGHSIVDGWRVAVHSALGMRQINAKSWPLRTADFHKATYISSSQISLNDVDSSEYDAYTSGGYLIYYTPVSLVGFSARMQIRLTAETADPPLVSLTSPTGGIVIDDTAKTITVTISAAVTAAYTFSSGVYDLEMVSSDSTPVVTNLLSGNITVVDEVTK